jgi:hypothetical protein
MIAEKTDILYGVNAVLRRTNCIGKDVMQSGDGTQGKNGGNRMKVWKAIDCGITIAAVMLIMYCANIGEIRGVWFLSTALGMRVIRESLKGGDEG